jgi:hypothetical protein
MAPPTTAATIPAIPILNRVAFAWVGALINGWFIIASRGLRPECSADERRIASTGGFIG